MDIPYKPPDFKAAAFNCPICNAYSHQDWSQLFYATGKGNYAVISDLEWARCVNCKKYSLWISGQMVYPEESGVQPPNPDLEDAIQEDYLEAKGIVNKSPRGAAALLRLCIQKLCIQLGEKGKNIDDDIAALVGKGLPSRIQQALDIVRVIGNNAIHPGQIDIKDDRDTAFKLFKLVNLIATVMITEPKEVEELYGTLSESQREHIQERDQK